MVVNERTDETELVVVNSLFPVVHTSNPNIPNEDPTQIKVYKTDGACSDLPNGTLKPLRSYKWLKPLSSYDKLRLSPMV